MFQGWLSPRNWWKGLLLVFIVGISGVVYMAVRTYQDAPPIPDFVDADGHVLVSAEQVLAGQAVFLKYGLMDYGSMFGDGASRGPDYTADALHTITLAMREHYANELPALVPMTVGTNADAEYHTSAIAEQVKRELKTNRHDPATNRVTLTAGQAAAVEALRRHTMEMFGDSHPERFRPDNYITDATELSNLSAFFYWGAWVCVTARPGETASYTHNWPYDADAGNVPGRSIMLWSVIGAMALVVGLGLTLYIHGRFQDANGYAPTAPSPALTAESVAAFRPSPTQRLTYRFFAVAAVLFLLQVLVGVLTVHDFVGFTEFFGVDLAVLLPITIVRSWHIQLSLFWISACWIAASIFVLPFLTGREPRGQAMLVQILFWMIVVLVAGSTIGIFLGPKGILGEWWRMLGHQGWEFVELGKIWQVLMAAVFVLWAVIIFRGVWPFIKSTDPWTLPNMLLAVIVAILCFFGAGFVAGPTTNFVIADFWRWCVIHMWAEAFFEVFTTVIVAFFMVLMGLVTRQAAARIVYLATLLFLGSGILGISHNFYWNAKPEMTLALGSVFSTLQVVPLLLLTLEAWRFRSLPKKTLQANGVSPVTPYSFGHAGAFLFLLGVNFWNFMGAGVFGFIINLPIMNYYEHGTYLTVNHGHAALMGVYGNLSLAAMIFVARSLVPAERWNRTLITVSFWSLNIGLALMVILDLFPAGVTQFIAVLDGGLWSARSQAFITSDAFQTMTWMRIIGGAMFTLGGVVPLTWLMVTRWRSIKLAAETDDREPTPDSARAGASAMAQLVAAD